MHLPIDIAVILAPGSIILVEFDSCKGAFFPLNYADESDSTRHASGDVDDVTNGGSIGCRPTRSRRIHGRCVLAQHSLEPVALANIGNTGQRRSGQSRERSPARQVWR